MLHQLQRRIIVLVTLLFVLLFLNGNMVLLLWVYGLAMLTVLAFNFYLRRNWYWLTSRSRDRMLRHGRLNPGLAHLIWEDLNQWRKLAVLRNQRLSNEFLKRIWPELDEYRRKIVLKRGYSAPE